jgi:hypothetical protein
MAAAVARLDRTISAIIAAHDGVRPVEQGEGFGSDVGALRKGLAMRVGGLPQAWRASP